MNRQRERTRIKNLAREELREHFRALGEPAYRGDQVFEWIYARGARSFDAMTNLPKSLRARLAEEATLAEPEVVSARRSSDGTRKLLLRLEDGAEIEAVLIPEAHRMTLCVSTQVGCPLACAFCATGLLGFRRNLAPSEIVDQFLIAERFAKEDREEAHARSAEELRRGLGSTLEGAEEEAGDEEIAARNARPAPGSPPARGITNVVLMGMGEPLLNAESVAKAIAILADPKGLGLSRHRITLSTVGILPALWPFLEATGVNLAISLHAPDPATRGELMPIEKAHGMTEILDEVRAHAGELKDRVTFEYVLLDGVNDSPAQARQLAEAIRGIRGKVNLLPFNPHEGAPFRRPPDERVERFKQALREEGVDAFIRKSRGRDIAAACGQLALQAREEEKIVPIGRVRAAAGPAPARERAP